MVYSDFHSKVQLRPHIQNRTASQCGLWTTCFNLPERPLATVRFLTYHACPFPCQAPYEHISLQINSVQWMLKTPMYPLDIGYSLRLCKISRETWHDMADYLLGTDCWQPGFGEPSTTDHPMSLPHYLSFAFTRSRFQIGDISVKIGLLDVDTSKKQIQYNPLLSLSRLTCFSWFSSYPEAW